VFSSLFAGFARRQQLVRRHGPQGIRIDVESGDVWVDGKLAPLLTDLEYKLLLLLYGNLDKICDKYKIVESVWGENYIDEVDDARIEKLVSRLREKLEPAPEEPKYLITIRGRGYKLVSPE
jgi:two-component system KDP operon response regulator KdpE